MDRRTFDDLTRSLAAASPRRAVLAAGAAGMAALLGRPEQAAAGCKKVGRKCDKNKDCCDGARCGGGECTCKGGRDECAGKCYKLDSDEKHCGTCNNACTEDETCQQGACEAVVDPCQPDCDGKDCGDDGCGGACGTCELPNLCVEGTCTAPAACPADAAFCDLEGPVHVCGGSGTNCSCFPTTDGAILCGDLTSEGTLCGQCQSSADCVGLGFGAGSFCARSSGPCCGPDADNICLRPCPA
jgi:hypothetical protein